MVAATVEVLRKAMIDKNVAALDKVSDENLSYGHSSGKVENKHEFIENIRNGKSDFISIRLSEQNITIDHHVAIVRHIMDADTNDGGKKGNIKLKILLVFILKNGEWKLIARQAVKWQ